MRNSRGGGGLHSLISLCGHILINKLESWRDLSVNPRALPMTGVISALPVNHRVGLLLKNLTLKIRSHVNDRCSLWAKLVSSMIRLCLNVTIVLTMFPV